MSKVKSTKGDKVMTMGILQYVEEILAICSLNADLIKLRENFIMINRLYNGSKNNIESGKAELAKSLKNRTLYKPCTKEDEKKLKSSLADFERELSALKLFDIKKRKEIKEKIEFVRRQQYEASRYLYYCDEISRLEKTVEESEKDYMEGIKQTEVITQNIKAQEKEISARIDTILAQIGKSNKKKAEIAGAITYPSAMIPCKLLKALITDAESPLLVGLPIDKQIKLLWDRDIPLRFGGMEWNVVEVERNRARLILRSTIYDGIGFSEVKKGGWDYSYGRTKLNGEFLEKFTEEEKNFIIPNEKIFGDKFFLLSKEEIDKYLDYNQRNTASQWWMRDSRLSAYSEDKERYVYYWDSYYDGVCGTHDSPIQTATSDAHYGNKHLIGYRPLVLVRIKEEPDDASWIDLWQNNEKASIICHGKWSVSNNYVQPYVKYSSSDVQKTMQKANGGSALPARNPRDDFNSNGTPSGHGGHFR